jgi:hypothetical protein
MNRSIVTICSAATLLLCAKLYAYDEGAVFIIADSTSSKTVVIREKYGEAIVVDSVTLVATVGGIMYVTRKKEFYGAFPTCNYSVAVDKRGNQ